jgi:hypothetical protein
LPYFDCVRRQGVRLPFANFSVAMISRSPLLGVGVAFRTVSLFFHLQPSFTVEELQELRNTKRLARPQFCYGCAKAHLVKCAFGCTSVDQSSSNQLCQRVRQQLRVRIGDDLQASGADLIVRRQRAGQMRRRRPDHIARRKAEASARFDTGELATELTTAFPHDSNSRNEAAAEAALNVFAEKYRVKYGKAVECLTKDRESILTFYDLPAEHWEHSRTTNPIESGFATVRHRTVRIKGSL